MAADIQRLIVNRLVATGSDREDWSFVVLAALEGEAALDAYLRGETPKLPAVAAEAEKAAAVPVSEPPGVYLSAITVEGFRGVGPAATLPLHPGPGLTLVVGRNGSGKSSFAEGLEVLLTGTNFRWENRAKAWVEGWRNLHHPVAAVRADLLVEGQGSVKLSRTWPGEDVAESSATARVSGQPAQPLDALGWNDVLTTLRPFLSYNELGALLEDGPSKLYDALSRVLGLDEFIAVQGRLAEARKRRHALVKVVTESAAELVTLLDLLTKASDDTRAGAALSALSATPWNLDALDALVSGGGGGEASGLGVLRRLHALATPGVDAVTALIARLREADAVCGAFAGTDAERCRERARLLDQAIAFHERHAGAACPVCGTEGVLTAAWLTAARDEVAGLKREAAACEEADRRRRQAVNEARAMLAPPPDLLALADGTRLATLAAARDAWARWSEGPGESATLLADHLENTVLDFVESVGALAMEAGVELRRREDAWRPVMLRIAAWLPEARQAVAANRVLPLLKRAEDWWKRATTAVRDERFKPIAERAIAIWKLLRLQSNVDLGDVELEGNAQRRRVALRVSVDGTDAEALGVMSQGELHSLALSLFLPRATLAESPFRFVSVDDPVQSMDPARVEGLAQVLAETARTRQVVVFTHDDRLPEAVRRLGLPATVIGVTRHAKSCVELRALSDAVHMYLEDARALVLTENLPRGVAARVVPGFCRSAIEAACMTAVRRRRLRAGVPHQGVEDLLAVNTKLYPLMALALFDDERQTTEVLRRLGQRFGPAAADAFKVCNAGAHEGYGGDLHTLVDGVARLTRELATV